MTRVRIAYTKWDGRAHWTYDATLLGTDEFGVWVGAPAGLVIRRPGVEFVIPTANVQLFPHAQPWVLAAYRAGDPALGYELYVDVTTVPVWDAAGTTVTTVDLDLDVVRNWDGTVHVLDEDEFAAHRAEFGYPDDVSARAERTAAACAAALRAGDEPFASAYRAWLATVPEPPSDHGTGQWRPGGTSGDAGAAGRSGATTAPSTPRTTDRTMST